MNTVINLKVEKTLKKQAQQTAKELGLPLSVLIKAYLKDLVLEKRVVISEPLTPNPRTAKILDEAMRDIKKNGTKNLVGPFTNADDFIRSLKN